MREDKRNPSKISQGWMAIVLLILAIIAVPAVALGTDLTLNATEPTAGVPLELPESAGTASTTTPEQSPTEAAGVTPAAIGQLQQYIGTDADTSLGVDSVMPSNSNVLLQISNEGNARFNDYGNNTYHFFSPTQSSTQGMNALHITTDPVAEASGQVTFSDDQSGVFYLSDDGGRGWDDNGILMLAVNGTIPDSFRVNIRASGYQWTPVLTGTYPAFDDITYVPEALNETFTKDDFLYGPQTWKPCAGQTNPYHPIFAGQDMTDTENTFSIMFIDLNAGILGSGTLGQQDFIGQSVTDKGAIKIEYAFENLPTFAAFNAYAYTVSSNQGQGIRWTNRVSGSGPSGYYVIGQPLPEAPTADFTANVTSGEAPLAVAFTDASTGTVTSWAWDFEDDGVVDSTEQNPVYTYTAAGTYTVNLTVANAGGSNSAVRTDYITVTEPTGPSILPGYNNIFVKVANDLGAKYNAFSNNTYNIRFEGINRGLNALHISTDPAENYGQVTVSKDLNGTFYATDSGGKGYEDEIILMVAVNGTIPDDFALRITADGYTWTPNPENNRAPSLDNVTYQPVSLDEVFTKDDFIYGPQIWKPTGNEADYPIYAGQDMNDSENTFRIMFIDLNAGVLRPNETLENRGAVRINYTFKNLESFAAFNVYGYCKNSNNGDDMVAWTNALTSDKAMSGYSVISVPYTPPSAPIADFTANVTSGDAPLVVAFTDASTGSPTSWAWDFENDGVIDSTEQSPVHTYTAPGTYTVNLTVTNDAGSDSAAKTGYITVSSGVPVTPDVASITVEPASVNLTNGATQQFSAVAYDTEGTEVPDVSFAWSSSNTSVGTLSQAGLFTAVAPGTATVTAAYGNVTGTAVVTVVTPPQGDQTQDTPLEIPGCNVTTGNDGKPQVSINTSSGTGVTVENNTNTITITQETYTLTIETEDAPAFDNDTVSGTVANIRLETNPIVTDLSAVGTVRASVALNLTGIPAGAGLTTTVSQDVSADARNAFQLAAGGAGLTLGDVAYTLNIVRTNLENGQHITGATIRMAVDSTWVTNHGGPGMIRIIRVADNGTPEMLPTTFTDTGGMFVFEATSPGFSTFGLAAVSAAPQAAPTSSSRSSGGGGSQASAGAASNLKAGESVSLTMDRTAISAVTLTAAGQGVKDALVTVAKGSLPRDAEAPAGAVYQYIEATLYRAAAEDFSSIQFRFTVPTAWLAAQGCTAEEIGLLRHTADGWQAVPVEVLGEEDGRAVFSASPEGFSLFAIAVTGETPASGEATPEPTETGVPAETVTTDVPTDTTPATPQPTPLPVWVAILALGVLLFVRRT